MGSVIDGLEGDTVAACLGAHARRHPDRVAIDDDDGPLTYAEIDRQVDRLAAWLVHRLGDPLRTQPVMVGLLMGRARSLVTGSMAVARAGLVSVAIDPSYPDERRAAVAIDAGVAVILTDLTDLTDQADPGPARPVFSVPVVSLSADEIDQAPPTDPVAVDLDALSAILYTSGSTGTPKGVMMSHRTRLGVCAYVPADASQPGVRCGVIDSGSSGGAEGVQCIPLVIGGCLVPFDVASRGLDTLPSWLRDRRVNAFRGVPSVLRNLLLALGNQTLPDLTSLAVFGEQLQWIDVERLRSVIAPDGVIHNTYGSSEASVVSDFAIAPDRAPSTGPVPVGPALPGRRIVIIDDDGNPLPAGDEGAVVAVDGLMPIGYWKRPELDAELYGTLADGTRTCRTGDRGWLDDEGWLHLAGREDNVVKIAGNRVDLGEVESVLAEQGGVTAVGATTRPDAHGDVRLLAYVVGSTDQVVEPVALRAALARRLPRSMLPDRIIVLADLPRLPGGKIDRAALPDPDRPAPSDTGADASGSSSSSAGAGPDPTEERLTRIFARALGLSPDAVTADADFFDLGGDSLRAVRVVLDIESQFAVDLPVSVLIEAPTIAALAPLVRAGASGDPWSCVLPVQIVGDRPPLFVVHDGVGSVMGARPLAIRLGPDQPVYAIRQRELSGAVDPGETLEAVVEGYVAEIRRVVPHGPYLIFGHSFGGVIGYEIARQLQRAGLTVAVLALGDSSPPGPSGLPRDGYRPTPVTDLVNRRRAEVRNDPALVKLKAGAIGVVRLVNGRISRIIRHRRTAREQRRVAHLLASGRPIPPKLRPALAGRRNRQLGASYQGGAYPGNVLLLRGIGSPRRQLEGWQRLVQGQLTTVSIPAGHQSLLKEPGIGPVADALREAIDRATDAVDQRHSTSDRDVRSP